MKKTIRDYSVFSLLFIRMSRADAARCRYFVFPGRRVVSIIEIGSNGRAWHARVPGEHGAAAFPPSSRWCSAQATDGGQLKVFPDLPIRDHRPRWASIRQAAGKKGGPVSIFLPTHRHFATIQSQIR
ncbi:MULTISPECIES: hypothetical protein [Cupriavidus]